MIFISDGGLIANKVIILGGNISPFHSDMIRIRILLLVNREFLVNAVHYLCDDFRTDGVKVTNHADTLA